MEPGSRSPLSLASLLQSARTAHPAFKYATVVAGLAALVAVVLRFGLAPATLVFGIIILIALMVVFLIFAQAVTLAKTKLTLPALVLTWTFLLLGVGTGVLLFSSAFFDLPLPLKTLILRSTSPSFGPPPERASAVPTWQPLAGVIWNDHQETVAQVEVFVPEFQVTTFTDDQGKFALQLQATPQRQARLIARKAGYVTRVEDPTLGNTALSFVLRRTP